MRLMALWIGLAACSPPTASDDPAADSDVPLVEEGVTWNTHVAPIVQAHCVECHQPGGVAPLDLTWNDTSRSPPWARAAVDAVASGAMPPWPASQDCRPTENARVLPEETVALLRTWAEEGFAVGRAPAEVSAAPLAQVRGPRTLGEADLVLTAESPWVPNVETPDEYRCFVLPVTFPEDTWVRGLEVVPDRTELVHHAILYQVLPFQEGDLADLERRDAEDEGPGYDCWGNPSADTVMAWAPGQVGELLPEGVARYAPAGSRWILQVHYNTLGRDAEDVEGDLTAVHVWTLPENEPPDLVRVQIPIPNGDLNIPAGNPSVVQSSTFDLGFVTDYLGGFLELPIVGSMGHMHQLGTSLKLELAYPDRTECVLDLPKWDFAWQMSYTFPPEHWAMVGTDADLVLTCGYDNSAANQPIINGVQLEPRDVTWGEGTRDEMCLAYVQVQAPRSLVELLLGGL